MTEKQKQNILQRIHEKIPVLECPMCHHGSFTIVDNYVSMTLMEDYRNVKMAGKAVPCVMIVCNNCGFVGFHALGAIGLLNVEGEPSHKE